MAFIKFRFIHIEPMNETSTMSSEQVQQEKQARHDNFLRGLDMANSVINRNPEVLAYYWYLWTCRSRPYSLPATAEQMTRRMIKQMPVPTEEERLVLQQHIQLFAVFVNNKILVNNAKVLYAVTRATAVPPAIFVSPHSLDINDNNARSLFLSAMILHELVHVFEPLHVNLEEIQGLFCEVFVAEALSTIPPATTFEQGEIFETMLFGGIVDRSNENEIGWGGSSGNAGSYFRVDDDHQYHQFLETFDLAVIRNILKRKKRSIIIRHFFQSIRHRIMNFVGIFRH